LPALQTQRLGKNGFMPLRLPLRAGKPSYTAGTLCAMPIDKTIIFIYIVYNDFEK